MSKRKKSLKRLILPGVLLFFGLPAAIALTQSLYIGLLMTFMGMAMKGGSLGELIFMLASMISMFSGLSMLVKRI